MFNKDTNNIEAQIDENGIMTLKIDTNINIGPSSSGKTTLVASSRGNTPIQLPDGRTINAGINIYYK